MRAAPLRRLAHPIEGSRRPPRRARDASCCLCIPGTRLSHGGDSNPLLAAGLILVPLVCRRQDGGRGRGSRPEGSARREVRQDNRVRYVVCPVRSVREAGRGQGARGVHRILHGLLGRDRSLRAPCPTARVPITERASAQPFCLLRRRRRRSLRRPSETAAARSTHTQAHAPHTHRARTHARAQLRRWLADCRTPCWAC